MKRLSPFFLLITISLILSSFLILTVNATNYEWVQYGNFESVPLGWTLTNTGFESDFSEWTYTGTVTRTTAYKHSGTYSAQVAYSSGRLTINFSESVPSEDFTNINFWYRSANGNNLRFMFMYSDATTNTTTINNSGSSSFQYKDIINYATVGKEVDAIRFWFATGTIYYDDFYISYGSVVVTETDITIDTKPWFTISGSAIINNDYAHGGSYAVHGILSAVPSSYWNLQFNYPIITQRIGQLNASYVSNFTLWGYQTTYASNLGGVRAFAWFLDGLVATQFQSFTANNTWQFFNFTSLISQYATQNKILVSIGFVQDVTNTYVYFDDVSLTATINKITTSDIFAYSLTPEPIEYISGTINDGFRAYSGQSYWFRGYLSTIPNGTFLAKAESVYGGTSTSGVISDYYFWFGFSAREDHNQLEWEETITLTLSDNTSDLVITLIATWVTPEDSKPITETPSITTNMQTQFITYFPVLIVFALFTIPATYWLGIAGFLGGIDLSFLFCTWFGLLPTWGIAILVLINVVLLYFKIDSTRNKNSGEEP